MFESPQLQRNTELRHVPNAKILQLSQILDRPSAWKKLMQSIPYELKSAEEFGDKGFKYTNTHLQ